MPRQNYIRLDDGTLVLEPVTPESIIRDVSCSGPHGHIGKAVAAVVLRELDEAGFIVVEKKKPK